MTIDTFTKEDFEAYLTSNHSPFQYTGLDKGEHTYSLSLDNQVSITIRSSIRDDSLSAGVGKDSIRVWLESNGKPISSKVSRTHRTKGWQNRLSEKIDELAFRRSLFGDCQKCGKPKRILKSGTKENSGRIFARCNDHGNSFIWLDKAMEFIRENEVYFSKESTSDEWRIKELIAKVLNTTSDDITLEPYRTGGDNETSNDKQLEALAHTEDGQRRNNVQSDDTIQSSSTEFNQNTLADMLGLPDSKEPNEQQRDAIEFDINSDLRVLAGPGSGKTFVMALRYEYLINNGVSPQSILVCTFGKEASLEMAKRIQKLISQANLETICTINALCSRLLTKWDTSSRWYGWKTLTIEWKIKQTLEVITGPIWREKEKPGAKEILTYINTTKAIGLSTDDSYEWFMAALGQDHGKWLYEIRSKFDAWLNRNHFITYADQLYLVEKKLQSDSQWRTGLQERFSHVIVDEAQDTTLTAMRILVTISQNPGWNEVYKNWK